MPQPKDTSTSQPGKVQWYRHAFAQTDCRPSLENIYAFLCERFGAQTPQKQQKLRGPLLASALGQMTNSYHGLTIEEAEDCGGDNQAPECSGLPIEKITQTVAQKEEDQDSDVDLEDDALATAFEFLLAVQVSADFCLAIRTFADD
jgi:hypothetical protein